MISLLCLCLFTENTQHLQILPNGILGRDGKGWPMLIKECDGRHNFIELGSDLASAVLHDIGLIPAIHRVLHINVNVFIKEIQNQAWIDLARTLNGLRGHLQILFFRDYLGQFLKELDHLIRKGGKHGHDSIL